MTSHWGQFHLDTIWCVPNMSQTGQSHFGTEYDIATTSHVGWDVCANIWKVIFQMIDFAGYVIVFKKC